MKRIEWKDITLRDFYAIEDIMSVQDEWTVYNLLDYIYKIDSTNMPITEIGQYDVSFLNECKNFKDIKLEDKYTINGTTYEGFVDITKITVAQFVDYQNYMKEKEMRFENILSVFIVPEGHTYNDGYDLAKAKEDILDMPFVVVQKVAFFLTKQLETFVQIFLYYSKEEVKKMKIPKEKKQILIEEMERVGTLLSELSPTSSNIAKLQMKH